MYIWLVSPAHKMPNSSLNEPSNLCALFILSALCEWPREALLDALIHTHLPVGGQKGTQGVLRSLTNYTKRQVPYLSQPCNSSSKAQILFLQLPHYLIRPVNLHMMARCPHFHFQVSLRVSHAGRSCYLDRALCLHLLSCLSSVTYNLLSSSTLLRSVVTWRRSKHSCIQCCTFSGGGTLCNRSDMDLPIQCTLTEACCKLKVWYSVFIGKYRGVSRPTRVMLL